MFLQLNNLCKSFDGKPVVNNLSLDINKGEMLCLLGPSGCGKTTTLKMIGGFLKEDSGKILIDGNEINHLRPESRPVSTVFQSYALFPHMTVLENVIYGLRCNKIPKKQCITKGMEYLELVGLADYSSSKICEISGGQQQRVALARSLIINPKVLLLDEPLCNLDAKLRVKMRQEIKQIQQKFGITMIFVTHDQEEAMILSDRIAIMNEGNLVQVGTPEYIYNFPTNHFAMNFLGIANKIQISSGKEIFVRPEDLEICSSGDICGVVLHKDFLGFHTQYNININGKTLILRQFGNAKAQNGDTVHINIKKSINLKK